METKMVDFSQPSRGGWTVIITDADIVPETYQNKLMVWRDVFKAGYFEIGDIANELCEYAAQQGFRLPQERIFRAVGRFCDRTGRTVRYYAETALHYPLEVRNEFEELPFSHFAFARTTGGRWREVLEYAMSHPEISAEKLEREFVKKITNDVLYDEFQAIENASDVDSAEIDYGIGESETVIREVSQVTKTNPENAQEIPLGVLRASHLSALSALIDVLSRILTVLKLRDETRNRLTGALEEIRRAVPEIMDAAQGKE